MKKSILIIFILLATFGMQAQPKINPPKFRIDAGPVVSCLGYYAMMDYPNSSEGFVGLLSKVQLSAKVNRKNEFYFSFEHKKRELNTSIMSIPEYGNSVIPSDLNHEAVFNFFGFGIRHFIKANNTPIGKYFGLGFTIGKMKSDPFNYTYTYNGQSGIAGYVKPVDEMIPHLTVSHGKRIMLNRTFYFARELSYSFNTLMFYDFSYPYFIEMCQYNDLQLTNFQYTISLGALF